MIESIETVGKKQVSDAALDSVFEIEDVLVYIARLQKKVDHWEGLKKHRVNRLNNQISMVNFEIDNLRQLILNTMKQHKPDEKTIDFTPIGKVTRKKSRKKWEIDNEEDLLNYLESKNLSDQIVEMKAKIIKCINNKRK